MDALHGLGIDVKIWTMPVEVPGPSTAVREAIPFEQDQTHKSYDADYVNRFWRALVSIDDVFKDFRTRFLGKVSPVHFWWGSFDHAVTRFSGRPAPPREGADKITVEAYSHEIHQPRLLARRQRHPGRVLCLLRARTRRLRRSKSQTRRSVLFDKR